MIATNYCQVMVKMKPPNWQVCVFCGTFDRSNINNIKHNEPDISGKTEENYFAPF